MAVAGSTYDIRTGIRRPTYGQSALPVLNATFMQAGGTTGQAGEATRQYGLEDTAKAREAADILRQRYIDQNPYAQAFERVRTGAEAAIGRQSEIDRNQLEAALARQGQGVSALRRTGARTQLNTELVNRYLTAEQKLGELQMSSVDRARGAVNDYMSAYLNIAGSQRASYQSYWQVYNSMKPGSFGAGGRSTRSRFNKEGPSFDPIPGMRPTTLPQEQPGTQGFGGEPNISAPSQPMTDSFLNRSWNEQIA